MNLFRNYLTEWLRLYSIRAIYNMLNNIGDYPKWRAHLYVALGGKHFNHIGVTYHFDHPMTTVLLSKMSIDKICEKLLPMLIEEGLSENYSKDYEVRSKFAKWLRDEDSKEHSHMIIVYWYHYENDNLHIKQIN